MNDEQVKEIGDKLDAIAKLDVERKGEVEKIHASVKEQNTRLESLEQKLMNRSGAGVYVAGLTEELKKTGRKFSMAKLLQAAITKKRDEAGFELEIVEATAKEASKFMSPIVKGLLPTLDSGAGYLIPAQVMANLVDTLRARSVLRLLGADMFTAGGMPLIRNKKKGNLTGYHIGAGNTAITKSTQSFGQITMNPKGIGAATDATRLQMQLADPSLDSIIRKDIFDTLELLRDLDGLRGKGSEGEPIGVANTDSIGTEVIGADGGDVTVDNLLNMISDLIEENVEEDNSMGWVFHPKVLNKLRKLKHPMFSGDTAGVYTLGNAFEPQLFTDLRRRTQGMLLGYPYFTTTQIPVNLTKGEGTGLTEIYFGKWSELMCPDWGAILIELSTEAETTFLKNEVLIKGTQYIDFGVGHAQAFSVCKDAQS